MHEGEIYLLEVRSFESAIFGDVKVVLFPGSVVDDGQSSGEVGRRKLSGERERVEDVITFNRLRGWNEVSGEHGQTVTSKHRCCIRTAWHFLFPEWNNTEQNNCWKWKWKWKWETKTEVGWIQRSKRRIRSQLIITDNLVSEFWRKNIVLWYIIIFNIVIISVKQQYKIDN